MKFHATPLAGTWVVEPEPIRDARGLFARVWCAEEFAQHGIGDLLVQANTGWSEGRGTLRGLHYQVEPDLEAKIVRCTRGAVFDVVVDLRPASPTFREWYGVELSADNRLIVHVPPLCAHGYLTLMDLTEVEYHVTAPYAPGSARGVRFDDPALGIVWPAEVAIVSERDRTWPLLGGPNSG